ncbi:hypothetical protein ZOSMA_41G00610 [Zostera marina]|uniref:DUF1279 domain-containing protein n=1 Tax=Zostera marina TaxID=29655 RepID=A0A0K9P4S0_ZOSMR|nr:hypothetical protein ZOSMA_41G00610 [Zostera marina]
MAPGRFRELFNKYGKVALGVHFSVSAASITGLYVAVKNNVDVESLFQKVGLSSSFKEEQQQQKSEVNGSDPSAIVILDDYVESGVSKQEKKKSNRTAEMATSSGGALAVAILLNKALFPVRVPITIALTPPISRFLARRNIIKGP